MKIKMTAEEQAIAAEIMNVDNSWETITEGDLTDFSLSEDPYKLPEQAEKLKDSKRFCFKWILNDLARLKEVTNLEVPLKWWIVNRTNIPELENLCSDVDGAVHCKDQILVFKPYWMLKAYQNIVTQSGEEKMKDLASMDGETGDGHKWKAGTENKITSNDQVMVVSTELDEGE
jgi:hypothetical protein